MTTSDAVTVRFARVGDAPAASAILNHYIAESTSNFRTEPYEAEEWAAQFTANADRYPYLVAEAGGAVAGLAYASPWRPKQAYAWTAESTVYVSPGHLGLGIGSLLYGELLKRLEQQGFRSVMAQISQPNPGSEALHARFGFELLGSIRDAGYKHGGWVGVGIWQKLLAGLADPPEPTLPAER
ncbi:GNAT family N-acetyltransferase [Glycomyces albidus]|jgi:phosphinothricin acetyltransferase|uniref:GNAT family N-acetyltransferase n=1 Tax=Glycomyces albidus TaxID=2656774 RepID=A0A6L5G9S8_9ACTN|nr:GNAT family N-acetyltransferase [Glycomyces albidus]MQM26442.1 GNAT family N-acetyltransferase [Glycomyces albidus]